MTITLKKINPANASWCGWRFNRVNPLTRLNYHLSGIHTAQELAAVITSLGLAQNLAAIRALATTGIQSGHMKLQYRSLGD